MQIGLEERDLAVEGIPLVLQLQRLDLGQVLDQVMAGQHTAMPDLVLVLAITGRATVTRRDIITGCLLGMCSMSVNLLRARTVVVVMMMMIDHQELRG